MACFYKPPITDRFQKLGLLIIHIDRQTATALTGLAQYCSRYSPDWMYPEAGKTFTVPWVTPDGSEHYLHVIRNFSIGVYRTTWVDGERAALFMTRLDLLHTGHLCDPAGEGYQQVYGAKVAVCQPGYECNFSVPAGPVFLRSARDFSRVLYKVLSRCRATNTPLPSAKQISIMFG